MTSQEEICICTTPYVDYPYYRLKRANVSFKSLCSLIKITNTTHYLQTSMLAGNGIFSPSFIAADAV